MFGSKRNHFVYSTRRTEGPANANRCLNSRSTHSSRTTAIPLLAELAELIEDAERHAAADRDQDSEATLKRRARPGRA